MWSLLIPELVTTHPTGPFQGHHLILRVALVYFSQQNFGPKMPGQFSKLSLTFKTHNFKTVRGRPIIQTAFKKRNLNGQAKHFIDIFTHSEHEINLC